MNFNIRELKLCLALLQIMTDLMINPPKPGDESFPRFDKVHCG